MTSIYFARVGEYVKIGSASCVHKRMRTVLNGTRLICPDDLDRTLPIELLRLVPNCRRRDELNMHLLFAAHWEVGEWFRWSPTFRFQMETMRFVTHAERLVLLRQARRSLGIVPGAPVKEWHWGQQVHEVLAEAKARRLSTSRDDQRRAA
ncbi:GIY-YIG nuclease family protein [Nocardioides sp. cx-169]|uniref:GIY-YIG nuclease family protein n=1 Tax=Nocardioides sp. cx-169 TaxID=2899080 RepID=UPI001E291D64|nr:GIY-YIG nuclease family protein [Nocardioides sp. cx-169]MCD4535681.1 GIY-YIG nuclease family protein [Nocardioides sp. cx-169]